MVAVEDMIILVPVVVLKEVFLGKMVPQASYLFSAEFQYSMLKHKKRKIMTTYQIYIEYISVAVKFSLFPIKKSILLNLMPLNISIFRMLTLQRRISIK